MYINIIIQSLKISYIHLYTKSCAFLYFVISFNHRVYALLTTNDFTLVLISCGFPKANRDTSSACGLEGEPK